MHHQRILIQSKYFLTAEQAFKLIPDKFFPSYIGKNETEIFQFSQPQFLFLKYSGIGKEPINNGTATKPKIVNMSYPIFEAFAANSTTGSIGNSTRFIDFDSIHGSMYVNSTQDRYVWSFITERTVPGITSTYEDATTGEIIGFYNPCPLCVWKPYFDKNFYA